MEYIFKACLRDSLASLESSTLPAFSARRRPSERSRGDAPLGSSGPA